MRGRTLAVAAALLPWAGPAAAQLELDANTLALWHFEDAAGLVAVDSGPAQHDLALLREPPNGAGGTEFPTFTEDGCVGGALSLHASSAVSGGYAFDAGPIPLAGNAFTVELFMRTSSASYGEMFLDGSVRLDLFVDPVGHVQFATGDGAQWSPYLVSDLPVNDGEWHYVAASFDGATMRLYLDGVEHDSADFAATIGSLQSYFVGGRPSNSFFDGVIDEVRVSSVARAANEIDATANAQLCPEPPSSLAAAATALGLAASARRRGRATRSRRLAG